ncbi:MAG: sodium:solute symporter family protein, partial [Proteobacteria bacterium]|nr:sodium:solute symporter family protein [Pseudomonadota bacterium]
GRSVEVLTTIAIVISYLGWVGAQITALGLVFNVVSAGEIEIITGMWIGSITILIYTFFGGMWAVAVTDLIQMVIIVIGMLYIGDSISGMVGGVGVVLEHARQAGKFEFWPSFDLKEILAFSAAWVTMMFGSIPQQDVFQRVQSSKTIKIAVWASVLGGCLYFLFAFVPMFLAYSATLLDPKMVAEMIDTDPQLILPRLVLEHAPLFAQVMFFGALLSAIKSCASATLLAPSVTFTENILKPMLRKLTDRELLLAMRSVTLVFTLLVTIYAINSKASIFKMVENAYQITLVAAFVPLLFGLFWRRATNQGALAAIFCGLSVWLSLLAFGPEDPLVPAQFAGLLASLSGMLLGSLLPQKIGGPLPLEPEHAFLHHHAAAETHHVTEHPHHHPTAPDQR